MTDVEHTVICSIDWYRKKKAYYSTYAHATNPGDTEPHQRHIKHFCMSPVVFMFSG